MAEIKTKLTKASAVAFIRKVKDVRKRKDCLELLKIFKAITKQKPQMWGTAIVGFGKYHYKSERSAQEGYWPLTGFSPRKQNISLYILEWHGDDSALLKKLGKHKRGGGCLYINKLDDVNMVLLKQLIKKSYLRMKKKHKI